jgi:hypothetical protein
MDMMRTILPISLIVSLIHVAGFPSPSRAMDISGRVELTEDTTWEYPTVVLKSDAAIATNGHRLNIKINGNLYAEEGAKVFSGKKSEASAPGQTATGAAGTSYQRGRNTEGRGVRRDGRSGGDGSPGSPGTAGLNGASGDDVTIIIGGTATGSLLIDEAGEPGGPGGKGGAGGPGGNGEQGGRGQAEVVFGVVVGAKAGPAFGGKGGDGGNGGKGGDGGAGGEGGRITLSVGGPSPNFRLTCKTFGGAGGRGGEGGEGGAPGQPGYGGRGGAGVSGREDERKGAPGRQGAVGEKGGEGRYGKDQKPEVIGPIGSLSIIDRDGNPIPSATP